MSGFDFDVPAESYDAFMGRYSRYLSAQLVDLAGIEAGQRVVDIGSGPGALTAELARRVGAKAVTAGDPSDDFVLAVRAASRARRSCAPRPRTCRCRTARSMPRSRSSSCHFMADPVAGLREMARVTRRGGAVAAVVWDHSAGGSGPLSVYYEALHELDPSRPNELERPGTRPGHLAELFAAAGFGEPEEATLSVRVEHETFEDWWAPYELGVGTTAGVFAELGSERVAQLRELCRVALPPPPFTIDARAWAVCARA